MLIARMSVVEGERSAERRSLTEETTIRINNRPATVEVMNLSATGCLIRAGTPLSEGMEVRIGLRGVGSFDAEVVRAQGLEAGCQFRQPLRQEQLDLAFTNNVVFAGNWDVAGELTEEPAVDSTLSLRAKAAIIVGLSGALWAGIGALIRALL